MKASLNFIQYKEFNNWSVSHLLANQFDYNHDFELVTMGTFLTRDKTQVVLEDDTEYKRVKIRLYNKGVLLRDKAFGRDIGTKKQFIIKEGQFLLSKIDARNGAFGLATKEVDGAIITGDFFSYNFDESKIDPQFLVLIATTKQFQKFAQSASSGTTGRQRIDESKFLDVRVPLPSLHIQQEIIKAYQDKIDLAELQNKKLKEKESEIENYLYQRLIGELPDECEEANQEIIQFVHFKNLITWDCKTYFNKTIASSKFEIKTLNQGDDLLVDIFRGKSPKYDLKGKNTILNQKCNRWNFIDTTFSKNVNDDWFNRIEKKFFTQKGDIIINSTGEGTIGRASFIEKAYENLIYDSHILLLRVNKLKIDPVFLTYFINSSLGQRQIENIKSAVATKQTELGIKNLNKICFILPAINVQAKIANHISDLKQDIRNLNRLSEVNEALALNDFESEIFA